MIRVTNELTGKTIDISRKARRTPVALALVTWNETGWSDLRTLNLVRAIDRFLYIRPPRHARSVYLEEGLGVFLGLTPEVPSQYAVISAWSTDGDFRYCRINYAGGSDKTFVAHGIASKVKASTESRDAGSATNVYVVDLENLDRGFELIRTIPAPAGWQIRLARMTTPLRRAWLRLTGRVH